jgi:hypothetical protein
VEVDQKNSRKRPIWVVINGIIRVVLIRPKSVGREKNRLIKKDEHFHPFDHH